MNPTEPTFETPGADYYSRLVIRPAGAPHRR
jgi:hypothetical protein